MKNWNHFRLGLSLIEVMIAISILAIITSLMVPRISGNKQRGFDKTCEEIGDILMMFGMRTREGRSRSGIYLNTDTNSIELLKLNRNELNGDNSWEIDPFVKPVSLKTDQSDSTIEINFYEDQSPIDISIWPLSVAPGDPIPFIEVLVKFENLENRLIMPSHSLAPTLLYQNDELVNENFNTNAIDLDAEGRSREDW